MNLLPRSEEKYSLIKAGLIATLMKGITLLRSPYSPELIDGMNSFTSRAGLLEGGPVPYEEIVATELKACGNLIKKAISNILLKCRAFG